MLTSEFRLPDDSQHTCVIGKNGSGKTVFGAWLLSKSTFDHQPKVIIDYKIDELLDKIEKVEDIDYNYVPKHPGLYRLRPSEADSESVEAWLHKAADRSNVGVYIDEGLAVPQQSPRYSGLRKLLTQGRSKRCPVTMLIQRPAFVSRFLFSESSFFAVFRLQDDDDKAVIKRFTPSPREVPLWDQNVRLPDYYCRWYDERNEFSAILPPAPSEDEILEKFYDRLRTRRKLL